MVEGSGVLYTIRGLWNRRVRSWREDGGDSTLVAFVRKFMNPLSLRCLVVVMWPVAAMGCSLGRSAQGTSFESPDPSDRIAAVGRAGNSADESAIPALVDRLEDEDSGVRFYAILALERIVGTRMGYDYANSDVERVRAVHRWREFVRRGGHVGDQASREAGS